MKEVKPPKKKNANRRESPESIQGKRPGVPQPPAAAERTGTDTSDRPQQPTTTEAPKQQRQPVTNQDEQDKITNASESNAPIAE